MRHEADTVGDTEADGEELEEGGQGAGGTGQGYYWLVEGPAVKTDNGQRTTDHLHDVPAQDLNAELLRRSLVRGYEAIRRLEASLLGLKRKQLRREMAWNEYLKVGEIRRRRRSPNTSLHRTEPAAGSGTVGGVVRCSGSGD